MSERKLADVRAQPALTVSKRSNRQFGRTIICGQTAKLRPVTCQPCSTQHGIRAVVRCGDAAKDWQRWSAPWTTTTTLSVELRAWNRGEHFLRGALRAQVLKEEQRGARAGQSLLGAWIDNLVASTRALSAVMRSSDLRCAPARENGERYHALDEQPDCATRCSVAAVGEI